MKEVRLHESSLVPNKKLRQLYESMLKVKALDDYIEGMQCKVKARWRLDSTRGQEACRVSTAIELNQGDLVSDGQAGVVMDLLAGAGFGALLGHAAALGSGVPGHSTKSKVQADGYRQLPRIENVGDRLRITLGAALALKTLTLPNIVVTYVREGAARREIWQRTLRQASKFDLPIIFVILPNAVSTKNVSEERLSATARTCGVPCIPVDASDAVALYRVAQEAIGRARGDGGPALIECLAYRSMKHRMDTLDDPILQMKNFLLGRKVCSETWLAKAGESFRKQLQSAKKQTEAENTRA